MRAGDVTLPPVFVCHDATGDVLSSIRLARLLPGDRPVYGVRARITSSSLPADTSVKDMTTAVVDVVTSVQQDGSYTLMGYSFGGIVALATARRLEQSGRTVDRVVMLDAYVSDRCLSGVARWWYLAILRPLAVLRWLSRVDQGERCRFAKRVLARVLTRGAGALPPLNETSPTPEMERLAATAVAALHDYRPEPVRARAVFVNSIDRFPCMCDPMPVLLAAVDAEKAQVMTVPGDHPDMVTEPGVQRTADLLESCLRLPGVRSSEERCR